MRTLLLIVLFFALTTPWLVTAGAWDYGPRDNDAALDLKDELERSKNAYDRISEIIETYGEGYESEVRLACDYLINELRDSIKSLNLVAACIATISSYKDDPGYLEAWDHRKEIRKALQEQLDKLKAFATEEYNKYSQSD